MLWTWACDKKSGSKKYLVASLDDFWDFYTGVPEKNRNFYEIIRPTHRPICFYADLEYSLKFPENQACNPKQMIQELKEQNLLLSLLIR
jgi:hypothetical protein